MRRTDMKNEITFAVMNLCEKSENKKKQDGVDAWLKALSDLERVLDSIFLEIDNDKKL